MSQWLVGSRLFSVEQLRPWPWLSLMTQPEPVTGTQEAMEKLTQQMPARSLKGTGNRLTLTSQGTESLAGSSRAVAAFLCHMIMTQPCTTASKFRRLFLDAWPSVSSP